MTFTENQIVLLVTGLRRKGKKIVFTNGVFDILHYGHIDYLTRARRLGDVLIVGLNRDSSVKKFKPSRPIQDEKDRARILAALKTVDYVVLFSEATPERLIRLIRPDILVKGADYKISEIVGADFVKSYGGVVKRIRYLKGRSTTAIIERLRS
nr:D-glycero-beta-D-manno-heptose 1-phosphate adenylyltransferase [candidate division Zixibacteria bacterium]